MKLSHVLRPLLATCLLLLFSLRAGAQSPAMNDPYLWLEDVQGERALNWAREHNAITQGLLEKQPVFQENQTHILEVLNNRDQIPYVAREGNYLINFWRDAANQRGLWRRTTLEEYRKPQPQWEVLLDLDALAKSENENWVWVGASCLAPSYTRCLVQLSRGGADAHVVREFDLSSRSFVADGFQLPEAKTQVAWLDADTLLVGTDFGPGSLTKSGYARLVKEWKRGTPLSAAATIFEAQESDVAAGFSVDRTPGFERVSVNRAVDFFNDEEFLRQGTQLLRIDKPSDSEFSWHREWAFLRPRSAYNVAGKTYQAGSLLAIHLDAYLQGKRNFDVLFTPTATRSLGSGGFTVTRDAVLLNILDNVAGRLEELRYVHGHWTRRAVQAPFPGTLSTASMDDPFVKDDPYANHYFMNYADFLTPDSLYLGEVGHDQHSLLKQRPTFFKSAGMRVEQKFATSRDGTRIPYFVVWPAGTKPDGNNPTILYGYGGFEVSVEPFYSGTFGTSWYARGGVLVVANIRGGGEFGPNWHTSAIKAHKQRSYDDFAAVAEDLIKHKISSPPHLGIYGGSNGGLLVGAVMLQRPELFGAVLCAVPLLDMQRYHLLLAGNSWMAEYGDPDKPEEWAWISKFSPYQNVKPGVKYPKVLFTTSTRDDRVHPGHARKMTARMEEQGHPVLYYENIEGGHGGAADNTQRAHLQALEFTFLLDMLGRKP